MATNVLSYLRSNNKFVAITNFGESPFLYRGVAYPNGFQNLIRGEGGHFFTVTILVRAPDIFYGIAPAGEPAKEWHKNQSEAIRSHPELRLRMRNQYFCVALPEVQMLLLEYFVSAPLLVPSLRKEDYLGQQELDAQSIPGDEDPPDLLDFFVDFCEFRNENWEEPPLVHTE